jgi:hypothetical protein
MTDLLNFILARQTSNDLLSIWTIYDHPADFPDLYVARRFVTGRDGPVATPDVLQGELSALREAFYRCGLVCMTRSDEDEPQIVESWL